MNQIVQATGVNSASQSAANKAKFAAFGGVLGALAASTCCILPLVLFSLGATGAWIGRLTALSVYQPIFICLTLGSLGYGYWLVYGKEKQGCGDGEACANPLPDQIVKASLWGATFLVLLAIAWPFLLPLILGE